MLTITPKEPQSARFTSDHVIIKDHYYYKGKDFSWNKPACINEKYYPFYHKQKDDHKSKIELMKQKEVEDKKAVEGIRKERLIIKKVQTKKNLEERMKEREALQRVSSQSVNTPHFVESTEEDSRIASELVAKKFNYGKNLRTDEFSWNVLPNSSKKNVQIYLGSYSVRGEEGMIKKLKERADEELVEEEEKKKKEFLFHKKLREMFKSRQEGNIAKDKKISRPQTGKYSLFQKEGLRGQSCGSPHLQSREILSPGDDVKSPSEKKVKHVLRIQNMHSENKDKASKSYVAQVVERLTVSREISKREFNIENNECQGMLVQNMNDKVFYPGNSFYDALKTQSKVFNEILEENKNNHNSHIRPTTGRKTVRSEISSALHRNMSSRPETARIKGASPLISPFSVMKSSEINYSLIKESNVENQSQKELKRAWETEEDKSNKAALKDMTEFDAQFKGSPKKVGYARVALEEAYRLTTSRGLKEVGRIETIKAQPIVK